MEGVSNNEIWRTFFKKGIRIDRNKDFGKE